jgi:protein TonB
VLEAVALAFANSIAVAPAALSPNAQPRTISLPVGIGGPHTCAEDQYPVTALQTQAEGTTSLILDITAQGGVRNASVITSSGSSDLDAASVACATRWQYRPAQQDGVPIEVRWRANVVWRIQTPTDGPWAKIYAAANSCRYDPFPTRDALKSATLSTVLKVQFAHGAVTNVAAVASSGNPDLDQRVVVCYQNLAPELAETVGEQSVLIPVSWTKTPR